MSAETGFLRIHYDSNQKPDWFPQVKIELQPTQNNGSSAAAAAPAKEVAGGRPLDVSALAKRIGVYAMLAAAVLFAVSVGTEEWLTTSYSFVPQTGVPANETMNLAANLRRGLWFVCAEPIMVGNMPAPKWAMPQCQRLDSGDCSATFTWADKMFTFTDSGAGDCSQYRSIRAFALLAAFAAGFSYLALAHGVNSESAKAKAAKGAGAFLGLAAGVCGMITMSLARSHFNAQDLAFNEYGVAFWLNVIAWPLALFAVVLFLANQGEKHRLGGLLLFIQTLIFVFFIVAVTTNEMTYMTMKSLPAGFNLAAGEEQFNMNITFTQTTWGLWEGNTWTSVGGVEDPSGVVTQVIDDSCNLDKDTVFAKTSVGQCDTFRTIRTFLIIAVVSSFFTMVIVAASTFMAGSKTTKVLGVLGNWISVSSSFLVIILSVNWFATPATMMGFSFWCIVIGHALLAPAMIGQIAVDQEGAANFRNMAAFLFSFCSLAALIAAVALSQWVVITNLPLHNDMTSAITAKGLMQSTSYGLWRICYGGADCVDIETDTTCAVNNGDGVAGNGAALSNCPHFNALRAFAVMTVIFAFFFVVKTLGNIAHKRAGYDGAQVKLGVFTFVLGFITTALASSYYGVASHEYGLSFWLFVVGWLAIFLVSTYQQGLAYKNEDLFWTVKLSLVVLVFYILAASTQEIVRMDSVSGTNDRLTYREGFFHMCYVVGNDRQCRYIHYDCGVVKFPFNLDTPGVDTQGMPFAKRDCEQFNGIRSAGILALLFQGFGFLAQLFWSKGFGAKGTKFVGWFAPAFAAFWGLLSMSAALTYYSDKPTPVFGSGFWLLTIAWVLSLFSSANFCCAAEKGINGCGCGTEGCSACAKTCSKDCKGCGKCQGGSCSKKAEEHGHSHGAGGHAHGDHKA